MSSLSNSTQPEKWCSQIWQVNNFFKREKRTQLRSPQMFYSNSNFAFQLLLTEYDDENEEENDVAEFALLLIKGTYDLLEVKYRIIILDSRGVDRVLMGML